MAPAESPLARLLPLAYGDLGERDAAEFEALRQQVSLATTFPCASYKEKCLRRRFAVRMRAVGVSSYAEYARVLSQQPAEYRELVDTLSVRVSRFFRDPDVWDALRASFLPELLAATPGTLRVWSAGCGAGEEPYSASILLQELAHAHGNGGYDYRILGSDMSAAGLLAAAAAGYSDFSLKDVPRQVQQHWFSPGPPHRLRAEARRHVSFQQLDLLRDPFPAGQHLIFCRNVAIYLQRGQQEGLFAGLHAALAPGGMLVLGKVEAPAGATARLFTTLAPRQRIFRKQ